MERLCAQKQETIGYLFLRSLNKVRENVLLVLTVYGLYCKHGLSYTVQREFPIVPTIFLDFLQRLLINLFGASPADPELRRRHATPVKMSFHNHN